MDEYKIEHGVPIPSPYRAKVGYALVVRKMKLGDSVFLPLNKYAGFRIAALKEGWTTTQRKMNGGVRVWLTGRKQKD